MNSLFFEASTIPEKSRLRKSWEYLHLMLLIFVPAVSYFSDRFVTLALVFLAFATLIWRLTVNARPLIPLPKASLVVWMLGVLLIWLGLSGIWSVDPSTSVERWLRLVILIVAGIYCGLAMQSRKSNDIFWLLVVSCLVASVLALLRSVGIHLSDILGLNSVMDVWRPQNRSVLILTVFAGLIWVKVLAGEKDLNRNRRMVAWFLWLLVLFITLRTPGLSPFVFWLVLTSVFIAIWVAAKVTWVLSLVTMVFLITLFPIFAEWLGTLVYYFGGPPGWLGSEFIGDGRASIWKRTIMEISNRPLLGFGLGTEYLTAVDARHPHNAWLQVTLNGGLVGLVLATCLIVAWMFSLTKLPEREFHAFLALTVALFVVATVSHGAWQSWWVALVAIVLNPKIRLTV